MTTFNDYFTILNALVSLIVLCMLILYYVKDALIIECVF